MPPVPAGVWRADTLAAGGLGCVPSGHVPLNALLSGGGWPLGALVELLPVAPAVPFWPLVLPALAARQRAGGTVVLVDPPHVPFAPALAVAGLLPERLLWVRGQSAAAGLWAAEQALRCADVAAVLAWLPQAWPAGLRRLQLAAAKQGDGLLFALRPAEAARTASPAPLRLRLSVDAPGDALVVDIVKRRGPPLAAPLRLPAQGPTLRALLAALERGKAPADARVLPFAPRADRSDAAGEVIHALDRAAVAA